MQVHSEQLPAVTVSSTHCIVALLWHKVNNDHYTVAEITHRTLNALSRCHSYGATGERAMTCVHVRVKYVAVVTADTRVVCANQQICYHSKRDAGLIEFICGSSFRQS